MYYVRKKYLPRRTFLQGFGATIGMPLLGAMQPAFAKVSEGEGGARTRLVCIEEVHGMAGCNKEFGEKRYLFAPETEGRDYELRDENALKLLEPWREDFTIISNTDVRSAEPQAPSENGADHFRSTATFLTQAHPKQTEGSDVRCGTSLDQIYAKKIEDETVIPSLQLGIESTAGEGGCYYNYSCVYRDCLSWENPHKPLHYVRNPRTVFETLFGAGATAEERALRRRTHASILDWSGDEIRALKSKLGSEDQFYLERYLESVRELETRIERFEKLNLKNDELPGVPIGIPDAFAEHMQIMFDLIIAAFEMDITRVVSFKMGRDANKRIFRESGTDKAFHPASHHGGNSDSIMEFNKINKYRTGQLGYLFKRLHESKEAGASLMEQTMGIWGSPMGDANLHNHRRCPLMVFGGANGKHRGGKHVRASDGTPMANAMLTVLRRLEVEVDEFGDSSGNLEI